MQAYLDQRAVEHREVEPEWAITQRVLWYSGLRCHELVALTWAMVDFEKQEIRIPLDTKTGSREIPLAPVHLEALQEWRERCGYGGGRGQEAGHRRVSGQAVGVPEYTAQGLRRLAVDALYEAAQESKVDVGTVAAIMGHSPATVIRHYRTPSRKAKRAAVLAAGLGTVPDRGEVQATP